jgi:hypothetical protein
VIHAYFIRAQYAVGCLNHVCVCRWQGGRWH